MYRALVDGARWHVRVNDFPEELLYTLLIDDREIASFNTWPPSWLRPGTSAPTSTSTDSLVDGNASSPAAQAADLPARVSPKTVLQLLRDLDAGKLPQCEHALKMLLHKHGSNVERVVQALDQYAVSADVQFRSLAVHGFCAIAGVCPRDGGRNLWNAAPRLPEPARKLAVERLLAFLSGRDEEMRRLAAYPLGAIRDDRAVHLLCTTLLNDPSPKVQAACASALLRHADEPGVAESLATAIGCGIAIEQSVDALLACRDSSRTAALLSKQALKAFASPDYTARLEQDFPACAAGLATNDLLAIAAWECRTIGSGFTDEPGYVISDRLNDMAREELVRRGIVPPKRSGH